jgi:dihydrolipoamide dehydrogenase
MRYCLCSSGSRSVAHDPQIPDLLLGLSMEGGEGFVRVVARKDNHQILGWQAVGPGVSELAAVFSHSLEMGERLEDVAGIIHAHPTLGEAVQEAALRALGRALHV